MIIPFLSELSLPGDSTRARKFGKDEYSVSSGSSRNTAFFPPRRKKLFIDKNGIATMNDVEGAWSQRRTTPNDIQNQRRATPNDIQNQRRATPQAVWW